MRIDPEDPSTVIDIINRQEQYIKAQFIIVNGITRKIMKKTFFEKNEKTFLNIVLKGTGVLKKAIGKNIKLTCWIESIEWIDGNDAKIKGYIIDQEDNNEEEPFTSVFSFKTKTGPFWFGEIPKE